MSMLLVVFGCFSAYRKISARQRKLMTAGGVGMRLDVDECDEGWVVLEVCVQSFLDLLDASLESKSELIACST